MTEINLNLNVQELGVLISALEGLETVEEHRIARER